MYMADWAKKLEGEGNRGKTECWYIMDAKPDATIFLATCLAA